tara:strand:+ start:2658 stop:3356 length:699 start_codon:yes stop_codon:yes gene_type:complete
MLKYFIKIILITVSLNSFSQETSEIDSLSKQSVFGIKIGLDLSKQIRMLTESGFKGMVFTGDYKINERLYLATEFGSEEKKVSNEVLNFNTEGTFLKLGANYNVYNNREGMENEIYVGFRYAIGKFNHKLNSYTIYNLDNYWNQNLVNSNIDFNNLNANWFELVFGFNAKIINNIYGGLSLRLKRLLNQNIPENFNNLYIPGFNKVTEENNIGVGFSYSIYYHIPLFKKNKN